MLHHEDAARELRLKVSITRVRLDPTFGTQRRELTTPGSGFQNGPNLHIGGVALGVWFEVQGPGRAGVYAVYNRVRFFVAEEGVVSIDVVCGTAHIVLRWRQHERRAHLLSFEPQDDVLFPTVHELDRAWTPPSSGLLELYQCPESVFQNKHTAEDLSVNSIVVYWRLFPPFGFEGSELLTPAVRFEGGPLSKVSSLLVWVSLPGLKCCGAIEKAIQLLVSEEVIDLLIGFLRILVRR